jgi:hypothetical protein
MVDRPVGHDEIVDSGLCIIISEKKKEKRECLGGRRCAAEMEVEAGSRGD